MPETGGLIAGAEQLIAGAEQLIAGAGRVDYRG
jgi:hypothetical protein